MIENPTNLCRFPYLDNAIFEPFKTPLRFYSDLWRNGKWTDCSLNSSNSTSEFLDNFQRLHDPTDDLNGNETGGMISYHWDRINYSHSAFITDQVFLRVASSAQIILKP